MNRLIMVGSPRVDGRCAHLADLLFETCIDECPQDELALAPVSTLYIEPCRGCDSCRELVKKVSAWHQAGDEEAPYPPHCVIEDDMAQVYDFVEAADELIVVAPVFFAGAPSQFKALIDRMQPFFWAEARNQQKRPLTLHVVGEGGDPHGFEPLIGEVRSAFACAGFELVRILDWVGKIDSEGEILEEAVEYTSSYEAPQSESAHISVQVMHSAQLQSAPTSPGESVQRQQGSAQSKPQEKPQLKLNQNASKKKGGKRRG